MAVIAIQAVKFDTRATFAVTPTPVFAVAGRAPRFGRRLLESKFEIKQNRPTEAATVCTEGMVAAISLGRCEEDYC